MNRFKAVFKSVKGFALAAVVGLVLGIVLIAIGMTGVTWLTYIGFVFLFAGIVAAICVYAIAKDRLHAICPECQKYMGDTDERVEYSYVCHQKEDKYDNAGKYTGTTFSFTCMITCPHCGNTVSFLQKMTSKDASKANVMMDKKLKSILKLTNK